MAKDKGADAVAGEPGEEGVEEGAGKKKPPLKLLLIAGAAAVLVLGGGGAAAFLLLKPKAPAEGHAEKPKKEKKEKKDKEKEGEGVSGPVGTLRDGPEGVVFYTLPDIVVNIQSADGRPTFLKLKLTLELADSSIAETLNPNLPRLQDMFQSFLRELRPEDLSGSQGSYQLRMEILRRVNLVVAPAKVNAVLIEEMLIN